MQRWGEGILRPALIASHSKTKKMREEKYQAIVLGAGESGVGAALLYQSRGISVMVSDYGHIAPKYKQELEANGIPYEEGSHTTELILRAEEIDWDAFKDIRRLGLTAGASAPEVLVEEIIDAFAARFDVTVDQVSVTVEDMSFPLPRELRSEAAE